jgi:hypothetical protein
MSITFTPESRAALERFSQVTGIAASQFVTNIIHDAIPVIEATTKAFEIARTSPQAAAELMTSELLRVQALAAQEHLALAGEVVRRRPRRRPTRD